MSYPDTQKPVSPQITSMLIVCIISISIIAALATAASFWLATPIWMMFIGWVNFSAHGNGANLKTTYAAFLCLLLGILMGMSAHVAVQALVPSIGMAASLAAVVFAIAFTLLSLAHLKPSFHKVIGYYLGMICFFASEMEISTETFITLSVGGVLGMIAGYISVNLQNKLK